MPDYSHVPDEWRRILKGRVLYQTHTWGVTELNPGLRGLDRRSMMDANDIWGKRVLDVGCATGAETFWAAEVGASGVVGLEMDGNALDIAGQLLAVVPSFPVAFRKADLSKGIPNAVSGMVFDTMFCFAITHHIGYRPLWREVPSLRTVYVEGHSETTYTAENIACDQFSATLLGMTPINRNDPRKLRPFFKLVRR